MKNHVYVVECKYTKHWHPQDSRVDYAETLQLLAQYKERNPHD